MPNGKGGGLRRGGGELCREPTCGAHEAEGAGAGSIGGGSLGRARAGGETGGRQYRKHPFFFLKKMEKEPRAYTYK